MTKTISTNLLNFTKLYFLSYFLYQGCQNSVLEGYFSIYHKYLHSNTDMNGSHQVQIILYFVLKDRLKQAGGHVHSGKQRIAAVSRASGINRYEDDLIAYIKLYKKKDA